MGKRKLVNVDLKKFREFAKTHSCREIADKYNVSPQTASNWSKLVNLRRKKTKLKDDDTFLTYACRHTVVQTAEHFNISERTVNNWRKLLKIKRIHTPYFFTTREEIMELRSKRLTTKEIIGFFKQKSGNPNFGETQYFRMLKYFKIEANKCRVVLPEHLKNFLGDFNEID